MRARQVLSREISNPSRIRISELFDRLAAAVEDAVTHRQGERGVDIVPGRDVRYPPHAAAEIVHHGLSYFFSSRAGADVLRSCHKSLGELFGLSGGGENGAPPTAGWVEPFRMAGEQFDPEVVRAFMDIVSSKEELKEAA